MALMTTTHMPREGGLLSALAALFTTLAEKRARFVEYRRVLAERISGLPHVASTSTYVAMEAVKELS